MKKALLLALSGASLTFAYAPFGLWPITVLALSVAIRQISTSSQHHFKWGWLFAMGWFGAGISWVHVSIADFGGLPLVASIGLMALLCGYLSLFPALAFWLTQRFFPHSRYPFALPFFWVLCEWLRSWLLSGFPWLSLGYTQIDSPLAGWLPIVGETGATLLIVVMASLIAAVKTPRNLLPAALVVVVCYVSGWVAKQHIWVTVNGTHNVAMIQGNIAQSLRWTPEEDEPTMNKYLALTEPFWDNDLIIWPEAAIPKLEPLALNYLFDLNQRALDEDTAVITGIVNYRWESDEAWNNLIVVGKKGTNSNASYDYFHHNRYAKHHLLPIGEFVPFEDLLRPLAPIFDLPMSSFSRGDFKQANLVANDIKLASALCFEIAFPRQIAANINSDTDIIITVSNDAWFGRSHGPAQHLEIARMRALEFGKPVIRATNNGITAFIDHQGTITAQLPQFVAAGIEAPVTSTTGITPYRYFGDSVMWLLAVLLLGAGVISQPKRKG